MNVDEKMTKGLRLRMTKWNTTQEEALRCVCIELDIAVRFDCSSKGGAPGFKVQCVTYGVRLTEHDCFQLGRMSGGAQV